MTFARRFRVAPLLLALLLLAGPLAAATCEPRLPETWPSRFTGVVYEAWVFLSRIWSKEGGSIDPFGKEGSSTDPFGKGSGSCVPFGKAGSGIDPFGKSGSSVDPFGKAGSGIDPFGKPEPNRVQPVSVSPSATGGNASGN